MEKIRDDFDRIAVLTEHQPDAGGVYDPLLLQLVPAGCDHILEIGCGSGSFTRLLATKAKQVTAVDLSPEMIRIARSRSTDYPNIEYRTGDILQIDFSPGRFDCIVMIATLHHLPTAPLFEMLTHALRPNGVLIIHDLLESKGIRDRALDLLRVPISMAVRWKSTGRLWGSREERRVWAEHARGERYPTMKEAQATGDLYFPGARVMKHMLWRYTLVWTKGAST